MRCTCTLHRSTQKATQNQKTLKTCKFHKKQKSATTIELFKGTQTFSLDLSSFLCLCWIEIYVLSSPFLVPKIFLCLELSKFDKISGLYVHYLLFPKVFVDTVRLVQEWKRDRYVLVDRIRVHLEISSL